MKVQATYVHTFEVTREIEVDEADFRAWADKRYGGAYDDEFALAIWIDMQDTEFHAEVFSDWRATKPLPADFEYQGHVVSDVRTDRPVCPQPCEHLSQEDAREGRTCAEHPCTCTDRPIRHEKES